MEQPLLLHANVSPCKAVRRALCLVSCAHMETPSSHLLTGSNASGKATCDCRLRELFVLSVPITPFLLCAVLLRLMAGDMFDLCDLADRGLPCRSD